MANIIMHSTHAKSHKMYYFCQLETFVHHLHWYIENINKYYSKPKTIARAPTFPARLSMENCWKCACYYSYKYVYFQGLTQDYSNSIAKAMELLQSCTQSILSPCNCCADSVHADIRSQLCPIHKIRCVLLSLGHLQLSLEPK